MEKQKTFQEIIVEWLERTNLTQKEFAKVVGCTEATLSRYVNGTRCPNHNTVREWEIIVERIVNTPKTRKEIIQDEICELTSQIIELASRIGELKTELESL